MATATRGPSEPPPRPDVGDTLVVIHDFTARSSDELSLSKGDRVELIERDDEFGDGWFLGRNLVSDSTGLFPEVYTRPTPRNVPGLPPSQPAAPAPPADNNDNVGQQRVANAPISSTPVSEPAPSQPPASVVESTTSLPLHIKPETSDSASVTTASSPAPATRPTPPRQNQDSQVLNDTLNVINEHITNLRGSPSNGGLRIPGGVNDSGSEYSMPLDHRTSYIQGEETDEEEDRERSRSEVESWTADQVAEYLFTVGVEKQHCEIFRDQEITGEVLLGMDQSSLFIKAFDLGSVGRRLKTWHKIKSLQDEANSNQHTRTARTWGSEIGSDDGKGARSRTNTAATSISNRISAQRLSSGQTAKVSPTALKSSPLSVHSTHDSPTRSSHVKRPSAASVRELHHSRRHSSTDYRAPAPPMAGLIPGTTPPPLSPDATMPSSAAHKKQASFDRNWTLGGAFGQTAARPLSSGGVQDSRTGSEPDLQDSAVDLDRGYFSGTETDGRRRNVLKKRDGNAHSRRSSYAEEQRVRSATALSRHSRFGSVDSFRDPGLSPAVQKYYGVQSTTHRKTASTNTADSLRPAPPAKDSPAAPIVTRIDSGLNPTRLPVSPPNMGGKPGFAPDWLTAVVHKPMSKGRPGMRAISDRLTNRSKDMTAPEPGLDSPGRATSSTASGEPSIDIDSPATGKSFNSTPANKSKGRKNKKDTSAYTRGLLKTSPEQAKEGADYYGWMKKRSSNLMTTWKPRLFVLKGRRLAYYYSEEDDQEKGLIDISFHRVLPADNERLTGLHATITGAVGGPSLPATGNESDKGSNESVFIFKLMPPRAGLSRAVNFTKPTVHYFAVPNIQQGRLWMAALMKATIDRDDAQPITTTYQQKTISLAKAKQMRHRPPALMNLEEAAEDEPKPEGTTKPPNHNSLGIFGESDSGVSGMDKLAGVGVGVVATANTEANGASEVDHPPPSSA
ncbi:Pleckstrin-domain containing protein [Metarhizium album ARSEF 1941]|uniref:Pleckstrin-domain containing protein n=1 Tax=Metarhizium album (strain ARSEF 1941) TaxID=1081103 RepID=A0A0B2WQR4_METAS|nr:Pleckstrin-domain containing protein [Metarhizium album ARSEF 1941]KHN96353.1 Pleckstrin-domain containing protein [Metarhizium album ARSEF 1941]